MPKLYLKRGLPGSGKSTSAREMVAKDGNTVRINFDDLRAMLYNSKWSGPRERAMNHAATNMISSYALDGYNVIIDNTNLTQGHVDRYMQLAANLKMDFVEQVHPMNIEGCVFNDRLREPGKGRVGRAVIERLAISSGWFKFLPDEKIWIFDVDGTLADSSHRAKAFLNIPSGDEGVVRNEWDKFFAASVNDNPIEAVQKWAQEVYRSGDTIIICSGRSDDYCDVTTEWLDTHNIPFHHILMRRKGDKREDWMVKQEILNFLPKQQIVAVVDDRQQVIDMWRRVRQEENLSYHVYQVAEGNF